MQGLVRCELRRSCQWRAVARFQTCITMFALAAVMRRLPAAPGATPRLSCTAATPRKCPAQSPP